MNRWIWYTAMLASVFFAHVAAPRECSAGPLLEWLSGRTPYYQPQPWHIDRRYPRTLQQSPQTTYPGSPVATYPAGLAYQQPVAMEAAPGFQAATVTQQAPAFQQTPTVPPQLVIPQATCPPGPVPNAGCGGCGLTRSWCAPRTAYRSTWVRVPVTRYRPALGTAETAYGVPATQPCNGYTWQLRRVPVTTYRPLTGMWESLFPPQQPVSYFGTQVTAPCDTYGTAIPQEAPLGTPYYPTQPDAVPGTTSIVPSAGLGTGPPYSSPASPTPSNGITPADRPPSLNPNGIPNGMAPNNARSLMVPLPPNSAPAADDGQESQRPPAETRANDAPETPRSTTQPSTTQPSTTQPSTTQGRIDTYFNVQPVRDPEPELRGGAIDTTPQLLGPNNHSAANDPLAHESAWQVVPIKWGSADRDNAWPRLEEPREAASRAAAPRSPRRHFDDSGWKSAR